MMDLLAGRKAGGQVTDSTRPTNRRRSPANHAPGDRHLRVARPPAERSAPALSNSVAELAKLTPDTEQGVGDDRTADGKPSDAKALSAGRHGAMAMDEAPNADLQRLPQALREIAASPEGPEVGAFFDLDGTLVAGYTAMVFAEDRYRRRQVGASEVARTAALAALGVAGKATFADLIALGAASWRGLKLSEMEEIAQRLFDTKIADRVYPEVRALIEAHRRKGHTIVLASSATVFQVRPTARFLGIQEVLCSQLEVLDGVITGEVLPPMMWGTGKARAVQGYAAEHGVDLKQSWFYADGDEDEALMHLVGHPRPTNPGRHLAAVAKRRGWPVQRFSSRGGTKLGNYARTAVGLTAAGQASALAVGVGILKRNRRLAIDLMTKHGTDLLLACQGIETSVVGEEHLFSHRPAVFIWNHRNNYDPLMVAHMAGGSITGVGKKELARDPIMGTIARFADIVLVDRDNHEKAMQSMARAKEMARKGLNILIAPEGTRSPDGKLQPFKKGAFRLAMDTGLPIVPVVFRNADVLGSRGVNIARPGKVDAVVLPPIDVSDWTLDDIDERIAGVRQQFIDTLADWPGTYS